MKYGNACRHMFGSLGPCAITIAVLLVGCGGGTGAEPSSVQQTLQLPKVTMNNMVTVPSDVSLIAYPQYYQNLAASSVSVTDPYCAITATEVSYPASYLGAFQLPSIQGAPLPIAVRRGAAVKDYWAFGLTNPATNQGCSGDLHAAFIATLARIKKVGADHVNIYRDAIIRDTNASQLSFINAASWSISDSELAWIVSEANKAGLKVHEYRQIDVIDSNNVRLPAPPNQTWATAFLDAYTVYIVDRARVAQQNGVEAFQLDWGVYWFDWTPYKSIFIAKMTNAAQQVRAVYSGKILFGQTAPSISGDAGLLANVDWLIGDIYGINFTAAENTAISVAQLKAKYLSVMGNLATTYGVNAKPVVWQLYAQSHRDYLLNGWVEDGFCVSNCMQTNLQTDFSIQAIQYEAQLEAISSQTYFSTASVDAKAYWFVDVILPKDSFPNISQSPRNKPAESILYQWFR